MNELETIQPHFTNKTSKDLIDSLTFANSQGINDDNVSKVHLIEDFLPKNQEECGLMTQEEIGSLFSSTGDLDTEEVEVESEVDDEDYLHSRSENVFDDPDLYSSRLQELEEEQEQLNSSLIALTSHFAQVQLRLKQIVDASSEEKEQLLKQLEEFAFRGIPDTSFNAINDLTNGSSSPSNNGNGSEHENQQQPSSKIDQQREKQKELMAKLKSQLEDLERYAYETGDLNSIPSSMLIERQSVVIEQLKGKLPLNLEDMDRLTPEQLKKQVDQALRDLINPIIMKEHLVEQLKTQVTDLERYIQYIQKKNNHTKPKCNLSDGKCTCDCPLHGNAQKGLTFYNDLAASQRLKGAHGCNNNNTTGSFSKKETDEAILMIKRVMTILNVITFAQFGCNKGIKKFERNTLKKTAKGSHWGDLRARLEVVIEKMIQLNKEMLGHDSDYTSDSGDESVFSPANERMTMIVRKELAPALRDLIEHGLCSEDGLSSNSSLLIVSSILDWGCFSARSSPVSTSSSDAFSSRQTLTAWDLILKYYQFKDGESFSSAPARRLSQSFNLNIVGGVAVTPKQALLAAIMDVMETHTPFKRSPESHLKAFLSRALNEGKLSCWLRLILKSRTLVLDFYEPWSYTAVTGFDDAFKSLDRLSSIKFDLPIDLAIRQLTNINEAF